MATAGSRSSSVSDYEVECVPLEGDADWVVHKFGGTSVANAECMLNVMSIIEQNLNQPQRQLAIVVSAMGGRPKVTDMLLDSVAAAAGHDKDGANALLRGIYDKHVDCLNGLDAYIGADVHADLARAIESDLDDIRNLLRAVEVMRCASPQIAELVSGYGETWSSRVLAALLKAAGHDFEYVDARDVLLLEATEHASECGAVNWPASSARLAARIAARPSQLVITGYIASTLDGAPTTLKRDGSDYSASIFGKLLRASAVHIWTDVDGVLSADPRRVPEAFSLEEVTYEEAMELAYFGAKVLHPKTMTPAVEAGIPLYIRNTFNPGGRGTRIGHSCRRESLMAGFTTVDNVAVLNVTGRGMLGVPGMLSKAAQALHRANISVRLIAQASSEQSIALAIDMHASDVAVRALQEAFGTELRQGTVAAISALAPCAIIAAVSRSLNADAPGRFYDALGRAGILLVAAAQGCDERNISAVVHERDARRALRCVHSAFLSHQTVAVALVGAGYVGATLLEAIRDAKNMLLARFNVKIKVCAIMNSDHMVLADVEHDDGAIDVDNWRETLRTSTQRSSFTGFVDHLDKYRAWVPNLVVVDSSYSKACAEQHAHWLKRQFHVINANTRALAGSLKLFESILQARDTAGRCLYCSEACVGGGVPIIDTLRNLVHGGDTVRLVECVISASLSFIFSKISPASAARDPDGPGGSTRVRFSEAVRQAWVAGLLENEPCLDLSGQDAATKLLALGRELGLALEPRHIMSKPLPGLAELLRDGTDDAHVGKFRSHYKSWRKGIVDSSMDHFSDHEEVEAIAAPDDSQNLFGWPFVEAYDSLSLEEDFTVRVDAEAPGSAGKALPMSDAMVRAIDDAVEELVVAAHKRGKVVRHVGRIDVTTGEVGARLEELEPGHAFGQLSGPELCVRFFTERYATTPLTVQGPLFAAGTASGLFAEVLRIVRHCSGHDRPNYSRLRRTRSMSKLEDVVDML
ncbi:Aspartate/glutamate/uridylate kinase [Pelagophyceae sp. CCMP2097]|nr:Aspartate/glutamate/uridylate kinase [Pelagophyceae sp. CCMP2097]